MRDQVTNAEPAIADPELPLQRPRARSYRWRWPFEEAAGGRSRLDKVLVASVPWLVVLIAVLAEQLRQAFLTLVSGR